MTKKREDQTPAEPVGVLTTFTPEISAALLAASKRKNVPTTERKIDQYGNTMVAGRWDPYNSQAISRDTNGDIVNGHQRLKASLKFNVSFQAFFIDGVPPETFMNEDTGRVREAGHFLAVMGERHYSALAAGARMLFFWERGMWRVASSGANTIPVRNEDLVAEIDRRPVLRDAAALWGNAQSTLKGRFTSGLIVALYTLTHGHAKHNAFWTELIDRLGTSKESAAWQMNQRIDAAKARNSRLTRVATQALLTKAWNFYATNDTRELVWGKKEVMPTPLSVLVPALLPPDGTPPDIIVTTTPKGKKPRKASPPAARKAKQAAPQLPLVPAGKKAKK